MGGICYWCYLPITTQRDIRKKYMGKYKIYKNKLAKYHPAISISINVNKKWENIVITSSPTSTGKFEKLEHNPNPNTPNKEAWFVKYIRKDPLWAMGEEFTGYELSKEDERKIDSFIESNKENREKRERKSSNLKRRKKKTR